MNSSSKAAIFQDAHVFDVDPKPGFMPWTPPLSRLPCQWKDWDVVLDDAIASKLQVGDKVGLSEEDKAVSEAWRARARFVCPSLLLSL